MKLFRSVLISVLTVLALSSCGSTDSSLDSSASSAAEAVSSIAESSSEAAAESTAESITQTETASITESEAESIADSKEEAKEYKSIKLMTLGDSITDGFWLEGGYRVFMCNKLEENGLSEYIDFVGSMKSGKCYDSDHEGHTAYAIEGFREKGVGTRSGIAGKTPEWIEKFQPDVVTLMIGTNDILSLFKLDEAGSRLEALVDSIFEKMPEGGKLYLASLPDMDANDNTYIDKDKFTVESMDTYVSEYNEKVKALADKKQSEGKNIEFCDVHSVIGKEDLYDGVHPSEEGYQKLADYWYDIIVKYISE